jgi:hypothetical protein
MSSLSQRVVAAEFARRAKQFHPGEDPMSIKLWGLFTRGSVSSHIEAGRVIPNRGNTKENKVIWCKPSVEFYEAQVKPLLSKSIPVLSAMAGWPD